jgi:hypothetical protein
LYQAADDSASEQQNNYYFGIGIYIAFLIIGSIFAFFADETLNATFKIISATLFLATLSITIWLRVSKSDEAWYNGRALAESVKTMAWRWMMGVDPYKKIGSESQAVNAFIADLKQILNQNTHLIRRLGPQASIEVPITDTMREVRAKVVNERLEIYRRERITNQELWYAKKSKFNKNRALFWFWISVLLNGIAIILLLFSIKDPALKLPIEVIAVAASAAMTWMQAKKFNELSASYTLTTHEIILIKAEVNNVTTDDQLSGYVINCENAFSREHTQWIARKNS